MWQNMNSVWNSKETFQMPFTVVSVYYPVFQSLFLLFTFQSAYWKGMGGQTDVLETDGSMEYV